MAAYGDDGDDNDNEGDNKDVDEYGNAVGDETGGTGGGGDEYGSKTPPAGVGSEFGPPTDEDGFKVLGLVIFNFIFEKLSLYTFLNRLFHTENSKFSN